ncbi:MAG: 3-oxoacyl-[acyl-carrier-protein] reductase [Synergistaceae bacterium]|jgi:3-oxoacyl-[acyl-carrier protein] reductase|nr:3-oxoacyl-[acyl-carrier-protein] reductase [Synergistaceae bacterium]
MLEKKVALVTGAGRGIGRAIAIELAKDGCAVAVNYNKSSAAAEKVVKEIELLGGMAMSIKADVSCYEEVKEMFRAIENKLGAVEVLVCNAGITKDNLLIRMKVEEWEDVISANLTSVFYCTKEAVRPMLKARSGRIIVISSVTGLIGNPGQCNYSAAKAGVTGFVKSLAREIGSRGVTVNAIAPGYIATDMTSVIPEDAKNAMLQNVPLGREGRPEDIAKAVSFLASEEAAYIHGQVLAVDGGMTM